MARVTTGAATGSPKQNASQREDLANFISNITRDDTPFMSSIGKSKAKAVNHEWSTDTLDRPGANANVEGVAFADANAGTDQVIARLWNRTQIFSKTINVAGTIEAVDKAGRKSEFKYQSEKRGKEMMRDIEFALIKAKNSRATTNSGSTTTNANARLMSGYQSWIPAANTVNASGGTITTASGDGTNTATTAGTAAAFTLSQVDQVMQACWQEGGRPTTLMMSPAKKRAFSAAAQSGGTTGNVRRNIDEKGSLRQSVEIYETDFGVVKVVPNYIMASGNVGSGAAATGTDTDILVYDSSMFKMATLRPLHHRDISEDGDQLRAMMVHETTLQCMNPSASGLIANLA